MSRTYSAEQRAEAVALAASIGPLKAGDALGIPRRTVAYWTHQPAAGPIIAAAEATIAQRLTEAHRVALDAVLLGLADPKARLGDRAQALRVLGEQLALAEGRATSRSENLNVQVDGMDYMQRAEMTRYVESLLAKLDAGVAGEIDEVEAVVMQTVGYVRDIRRLVDTGEVADDEEAARLILERERTSG